MDFILFFVGFLFSFLLSFCFWGTLQEKSSTTERIEQDLGRARAAIRKAILTQNYTSDKEEIYVPTGPVYRNAYAFHQLSSDF